MKTLLIISVCFVIRLGLAQEKCDSISFYENGKISYLRTKDKSGYLIYKWYANGHIQSRISHINYMYFRTENYEDGSLKFDSASTHTMSSCEYYYRNGILQRRVIEHKKNSSYFKTDPPFSFYEFDSLGHVSLIVKKDMEGKIIAKEKYPFEKEKTRIKEGTYYPGKTIKQYGFYYVNKTGAT